ncbi:MAG: helix-turn-helix domain-containing protein [Chitinophagaceae bacterium]
MKEKKKQKNKLSPLSKSPWLRRSKEEMELIIGEIRTGSLSIWSACRKYGLNRNTLKLWMTRLRVGSLADKTYTTVLSSKEEDKKAQEYKQQIRQLEKALKYANLRIPGLETMIKVSEEDLQIKIKKKPGTKQSKK